VELWRFLHECVRAQQETMKVRRVPELVPAKPTSHSAKRTVVGVHQRRNLPLRRQVSILVMLGALLVWALPPLAWAFHVQRATTLLDNALMRPIPPRSDSVPSPMDTDALHSAERDLTRAIKLYPSGFVYRQLGRLYNAQEAWAKAHAAYAQALERDTHAPLAAWEALLLYERMHQMLAEAPKDNLIPDLASVPPTTPSQSIETTFCSGTVASCYVGLDRFSQPFADTPNGPAHTVDVLFMHPPSSVALRYTINRQQPALSFVMGLDPNTRSWNTDGASYEILVTARETSAQPIFQYTLNRQTALQGWVPGWVDLSPWIGQTITLTFRTTGGPQAATTDDWYSWGNVHLTSISAAQIIPLQPVYRLHDTWPRVEQPLEHLTATANEYWHQQDYQSALRWYNRAATIDPAALDSVATFRRMMAQAAYDPEAVDRTSIPVQPLTRRLRIDARTLQWDDGTLLAASAPNADVGVLWWSLPAVTLLDVAEAGAYTLTVRVQDTLPAPTELEVLHNLVPNGREQLTQGDGRWREIRRTVHLRQGLNSIGLRLANDGKVDGLDRNAVIDWLQLERQH
jgi:tetratricopeptide (TPR) repeat protein